MVLVYFCLKYFLFINMLLRTTGLKMPSVLIEFAFYRRNRH